jgi:hypothetical protein
MRAKPSTYETSGNRIKTEVEMNACGVIFKI